MCTGFGLLSAHPGSALTCSGDIETEYPGCRDGSMVKALFAFLEDLGSVPSIHAVSAHYL